MRLRNVSPDDVDAYVRMRCDPVMMADLGGPQSREEMAAKVRRDAEQAAADLAWLKMIVPDPATPEVVAGTVTLWSHNTDDGPISEIGWMVLPQFQGQGLGKRAVRALLELAREENRWGVVHAFPATGNAASNGICRSVGFRFVSVTDMPFAGQIFKTNHWSMDPRIDLT
ncbi:Protein N-acetyltransferase, RimJ/RimL family [Streptomyces sp. 1222.5]|uniref:GNAT family N-acetyltransferase n=1 Tax=unclassified Streptomyces TaxID=2593676 RepID=UPI000895E13C|nr:MULTISPECIES: GNAT family N-acetyltransferase [unclassified Streptomyces]PKW07043.1 RimJ/RimL family protein N-acetyltransferase [Streptomyces sp. 5112.2]SEC99261.1 Protein N-acetyltransferase, RimJ/RimL family [Streptomyces sp. 1222.5]